MITKIVRRFWPGHPHIIDMLDMAIGVSNNGGIPVTGWKFRCILCGSEFLDVTESGIRQLQEGNSFSDAFKWTINDRIS